ncbi:hypothetical protein A3K64_02250 [Candidatus Micrarchaeota archaeon RBG_16_36_9]|nr:MAG: hypothetical protein A3K64_02250 [Candidatus Micrarchaeota archaeon RBG_16_36_9]
MTKSRKKKTKVKAQNKNIFYLVILIVAITVFAFLFYYFPVQLETYEKINDNPSTTESVNNTGGFCKTDFECFVTSCKGQSEDCVNITQLSEYSQKCKAYSDWLVGRQDNSKCDCIENACTLK